jgi:hypothetical protein
VYDLSFFPTFSPHQYLFFLLFLMMAILTGVRRNFSVVLNCISFMVRYGEHFFMFFYTIWISSFEKVLFCLVAHFFIGSLILGESNVFKFPLYSGYQSFVWCIAGKYFLPLCGWLLQFKDHFFCCAKTF